MPLQRPVIERSPFHLHLSISNVRTLKRHKCRAPSRSVATLSIALARSSQPWALLRNPFGILQQSPPWSNRKTNHFQLSFSG